MKVFILLCLAAVALASRQNCGENSHYESCGTACPLTCKNYQDPPKACVYRCNPGCHCDKGYVKTTDGRCVKPEECPAEIEHVSTMKCRENSRFMLCGTACPLTCRNYKNPPKMCPLMCKITCQCNEGYVKTDDGYCVRPEECPAETEQVCGENQVFNNCGSACPLTCDNYQNPPKVCTLQCVVGCECANGYVKTRDGRCVRPEECPAANEVKFMSSAVCGKNEVFNECGTACPLTCDNHQNPPKICTMQCVIGCQCEDGYVKTRDGRCVRPVECPAANSINLLSEEVCGENEVFAECGTACPRTCANWQNPNKFCTLQCKTGCMCVEGFVQTSDGKCVKPQDCPATEPKTCQGEPETGPCRGYFPMWYYDVKSAVCKTFVYGGCGGNGNRYKNGKECMQNCEGKSA